MRVMETINFMTKEQFLTLFFFKLKENEVDYFVFGEYRYLPKDTGGSDIDIVVDYAGVKILDALIKKIAKSGNVVLAAFYENPITKFYRFITQEWGVQIDVFYRGFRYRGCEYYPICYLKKFVIDYNSVKVLSLEKGFYVDFFKEVLHTGKVKEKYVDAFLKELAENNKECFAEIRSIYGDKVLTFITSHSNKKDLLKNVKTLHNLLKKRVTHGHLISVLKDRLSAFFRLFKRRPGYVIVVEGTDGSGKSFIINSITPILNECFHHFVIYNHLRPNLIPDLGIILGKKERASANVVCTTPHAQKTSGFAESIVRWGYYLFDYTVGYLKKVWFQIHSKSKVFIFDRYYYDYYLDQRRFRIKLPKWIIKFGELFVPSPDLILCLGGDPEKIYARKPETSLEEVTRQTKVLKDFCNRRKNAVWIDTTIKPEESVDAAMKAITAVMGKRFKIEDI